MNKLLYFFARALIAFIQALPLTCVARLGRAGGALAYWLDARHRRVALANLTMCFGKEKSAAEIRAIAKENFRRIGEGYASAVKTAAMSWEQLKPHCEFAGVEPVVKLSADQRRESLVVAIGHFGNFELFARFGQFIRVYRCAATYRALRQPLLNRLMQSLREQSECLFFERRTQFNELKTAMTEKNMILGLLADQHAGDGAVRLPFFGHECSTSAAPAVLALRYEARLLTAFCYRVRLAHWRIELGDEIATHENGQPRPPDAIMRDVNTAFEKAIRRDPANWFWVHNRWKPPRTKLRRQKKIFPPVPQTEVQLENPR